MRRQGWLQDPKTTETKRFHRDERSHREFPMVFIDSGRPFPGKPALLKRRQHVHKKEAMKNWEKLLKEGWKVVKPQWGKGEEV